MIVLRDASKEYADRERTTVALRPTTLEVEAGEYVAIVGESGSGKSTLLSLVGGMLAPSTGTVSIQGESLYTLSATQRAALRLRTIGFVFQTFNLVPYMTARENVELPMVLAGKPSNARREQAEQLLARFGLKERMHHRPFELSTGQQQRVALARTLANDPPVILADEPTGNLDPANRRQVLEFLTELNLERRTILMVTHDPAAAACAHRQLRLEDGRVLEAQEDFASRRAG